MSNKTRGLLTILFAAASFGAVAPIAKYIYQYEITPNFMLALRFLFASLLLWGYLFINKAKINCKLNKYQLLMMLLIGGVVYFLTTIFYFNAIRFIPVSLHVMIFYSYPFMVNIFSYFVLKEKITKKQFLAMMIAFGGLFLTVSIGSLTLSTIGILFSLLAAVCNASYILLLGIKKISEVNSIVIAAYTNLFSSLSFFIYCGIKKELYVSMSFNGWAALISIALFSTAMAIIALSYGVRLIGASQASIISTFEPLEGVILSFLFLGERLNIQQIAGVVLVLSAIVLINSSENKDSTLTPLNE